MNWRVAEQLERLDPRRIGEIAYHYAAGGDVGDLATVVRSAFAAADDAIAGAAFEEAAGHARTALGALDRMAPEPRLRFRALCCLGVSLNAIADEQGSGPTWLEAADIARELDDPEALFATVVGFGYLIRRGHDIELMRLLDDVLKLIARGLAVAGLRARLARCAGVPERGLAAAIRRPRHGRGSSGDGPQNR